MERDILHLLRGTDAQVRDYTGPIGEAVFNLEVPGVHFQDSVTPGGLRAANARNIPCIHDWNGITGRNITVALQSAIRDLLSGSAGATLMIPGNRYGSDGPWLVDPMVIQPITGAAVPLCLQGDYYGTQIQPSSPISKDLNGGH